MLLGPFETGRSTVGLHRGEGTLNPDTVERRLKPPEILLHDGLHVGVEHRRVRPLILAPFARNLVRRRDGNLRQSLAQESCASGLMLWSRVAVQELDRDGLDTFAAALRNYRIEVLKMEPLEFLAPGVDAFANLEAIPAAHNRRFFFEAKIIEIGAIPASDLQHVAKACRSDKGRFGALALGDDVDNGGAAVDEEPHLAWSDLREPDGIDHALREFARGGQRLRYA
jgi:hypothetical protein